MPHQCETCGTLMDYARECWSGRWFCSSNCLEAFQVHLKTPSEAGEERVPSEANSDVPISFPASKFVEWETALIGENVTESNVRIRGLLLMILGIGTFVGMSHVFTGLFPAAESRDFQFGVLTVTFVPSFAAYAAGFMALFLGKRVSWVFELARGESIPLISIRALKAVGVIVMAAVGLVSFWGCVSIAYYALGNAG